METAEAELEDQLARLTGAARVAPLLRLAQLRSNRYVRLPAGSAAAGAVLEPGIANLREAQGLLPADDPGRPQVDNALGWLLSIRYSGHGGSPADRDTAIELLTGSVDTARLAPVQQQAAYLILGQLSTLRALQMDPTGPADPMKQSMAWMATGLSARSREDLDRAHDYLTRVVAAGPVNEQVRQAATAMLQMVTMMRDMFGGMGQGNLMANFNHLMTMMSRMGGAPPSGGVQSPVWTPTMGMPTIIESTVIPPVSPAPVDGLADLRAALVRRLTGHAGVEAVEAVLRPETPPMPWTEADEAVATATAIHDGAGSVAADGVLLAVTLWLRARADDGGGWGGDPGASAAADRTAGLAALLDAVSALRPEDPRAGAALAGAVAFLADGPPLRGIPDASAERCVERCDAVGGTGLRALREVCRAGLALRGGHPVDAAAVEEAASMVPADDPWRARLLGALGGALFVHALADVTTDAEPARQGLALMAAPADAVVRLARALLDGTDDEVARSAGALPDAPAEVRAVVGEFGAGPGETLDARAVGRLVTLNAPAEAFAVAGSGARTYLLRWVAGVFGAAPDDVRLPDGVDVLACVHPVGRGELCTLVVERDGPVGVGGVAAHPGVEAGEGWVERARPVLGPVLGPGRRRIMLLAPGGLGALPWAAAAGDEAVLWTVGRRRAGTGRIPDIDADAVFVANPAGDRDQATIEAMVLRRMLYPTSTGLGRTVEEVHGSGTPDEVLAHLPGPAGPGASLLHLGCAVRTGEPGALGLAPSTGPAWLDLRRVTAQSRQRAGGNRGGLVVLPADAASDATGLLAVADTLLDAGMSGAVHWLRPVPPPVATLVLYRLHEYLVDDRMSPPDAVAAVRRWMRDPNRRPPRCVPAGPGAGPDLTDPALWGALAFRA